MTTIYLALGSNVGDSPRNIAQAIDFLSEKVRDIQLAPLYTSRAKGYEDQPNFLNTALHGKTALNPQELLVFVKEIEQKVGRIVRFRWGPREIDIDIIFYGSVVLESERLALPHPRYRERDFVLKPLLDLNQDITDPATQEKVSTLLAQLPFQELSVFKQFTVCK